MSLRQTNHSQYFDDMNYEPTNNPAVDMVVACISYYRKKMAKLTEIQLREDYFDMFEEFVKNRIEVQDGQGFMMDGVPVIKAYMNIGEPLFCSFHKED